MYASHVGFPFLKAFFEIIAETINMIHKNAKKELSIKNILFFRYAKKAV
jgi:hypothetical protein